MSRLFVFVWVLWGLGCGTFVAPVQAGSDAFFSASSTDLQQVLTQARQERKGLVALFEMAGCSECRKLRETVLRDPAVQNYYRQHFLSVSFDLASLTPLTDFTGQTVTPVQLALAYRVRVSPTLVFYDASGQPVTHFTGPIQDAAEFLQLGRYVADAAYESAPFRTYQQQHSAR